MAEFLVGRPSDELHVLASSRRSGFQDGTHCRCSARSGRCQGASCVYLAKGVLATTAIEGNTLTEEEVRWHLEGRLELPPSRQYLAQEIDNIVAACNGIVNAVMQGNYGPITTDQIREYNRLVLEKLPLQDGTVPGEFRSHSVVVGGYRAAPPEDCAFLLERFCNWLNTLELPEGFEQAYSILAAIAAHLYFVWIHPFGDGNGRTARLIEFRYLLQAGFPTPAAHVLSNFYNLTRTEYYRQLDRAGRSGGQMEEFIAYAIRGLVDPLIQGEDQPGLLGQGDELRGRNQFPRRIGKIGTSGGVDGARHDACFMAGGVREAVERVEPILIDLAVDGG